MMDELGSVAASRGQGLPVAFYFLAMVTGIFAQGFVSGSL